MRTSFYQNKVLYILITVLIVVQISAFFIQVLNHRRISEQTLEGELKVGERVAHQILAYRSIQLQQIAEILAKDYGFLETFLTASQDPDTLESVLENHRNRADAGIIMLSSIDQHMIAQSPRHLIQPAGTNLQKLLPEHNNNRLNFSSFFLGSSSQGKWQLFHIIKSPLKAPTHLADLTVGYEVNDVFLKHLRRMTNLELMVISKFDQNWNLHASTLSDMSMRELKPLFQSINHTEILSLSHNQEKYLMLASKLSSTQNQTVYLVIARPWTAAVEQFKEVERVLYFLLALSILFSVIAIYYVTKRFVYPLSLQAHSDNLTGIGNRRLLMVMMERAILNLKSSQRPVVLLLLDLNKFKPINDSLGHDAGDLVLKSVAQRIKNCVRLADTVVRLGGDEYAVLLDNCHYQIALQIVESISVEISQPIMHMSDPLIVHASIGVTVGRVEDNIDKMIKRADEAMYEAKSLGRMYIVK